MKHRHNGLVRYIRKGRIRLRRKPLHKVTIKGRTYSIYRSNRKNKEYMVEAPKKIVHFADPNMPEYPGTKRGNNYCTRSYGIKGVGDINSANFWSRKLWSCKNKKSTSNQRFKGG